MTAIVVRRFVGGPTGGARYSIRRRAEGGYQVWHDNPFEGSGQHYEFDDQAISGVFGDIESAEAELVRNPDHNFLLRRHEV